MSEEINMENVSVETGAAHKRGFDFWMVYVSNMVIDMLSVLDVMAVSTALPTIVSQLHGTDFIWAGSASTITATAVVPFVGDFVSAFGRKPVLLALVFIFAVGSAISGAAQSMNMLIVGRAIQGFGGGGCMAVTEIVYADMVPLPERGKFQGLVASVWGIGCAIGPPIGGALANSGQWRWLFYLNLPLCGIAMVLTSVFLRVQAPKSDLREKLKQMDWIGVTIIVGSAVALTLAFTVAGIQFPWDSARVLFPLIIGGLGIVVFLIAERYWLQGKIVPIYFFNSRTTLSGYIGTFFHGVVALSVIYYLPVYFQAVQDASAIVSGVDIFPITLTIPFAALATGISVQALDKYRPQNYVGWGLTILGFGVVSRLDATSSKAAYVCSQLPLGIGLGIVWVGTQFPILAPLPVSNNAHALAFFTFIRNFAMSLGIAMSGTILQNVLLKDLPASYVATLPEGVQIAYAVIPDIRMLHDPLREEVRDAFANAMQLIWRVMLAVSGVGLLSCLLMKEEKLVESLDAQWGLKDREKDKVDREVLGGTNPTTSASDVCEK